MCGHGIRVSPIAAEYVALCVSLQVMREVGWVVFDEIHYMRDPGKYVYSGTL